MNEDGEQTEPTVPSRPTLAASTLRALRAGRGGGTAAAPELAPPGTIPDREPNTEPDTEPDTAAPVAESPGDGVEAELSTDVVEAEPSDDVVEDETVAAEPAPPVNDEPAAPPVEAGTTDARRRRGRLLTVVCAALAAAALVFAVVAGVVWWTAGHSEQHRLGVARVQVKKEAKLAIATVNTSDYRHPSAALSNWLDVSTGALHSQFDQSRSAAVKLLAQAETVTKADVLADAVTSVDLSKGSASVIASVNVTRTHNGSTSTVRNRFRATMTRSGGRWKIANLTVVSVSLS